MKKYKGTVLATLVLSAALLSMTDRMEIHAAEAAPVQITDPNAVVDPGAIVPPAEPAVPAPAPQPVAPVLKKEDLLTDQMQKDIENMLEDDVQDAIINGYLSLLNKNYILRDELDMELVGIGNGHRIDPLAAEKLTQMVKDAQKERLYINVTSSYRTYLKQVELFRNKIQRLEAEGYTHDKAVREAATVVAVPGTSEHHLGLTVDFVTGSYKKLDEGIRDTDEYRWVEEHAWEYGYIIRYPQGKSKITGIITEPWHLRYVGIPAAKLIHDQGICLEEFLGVAYDGQKDGISYGAGWINTGR